MKNKNRKRKSNDNLIISLISLCLKYSNFGSFTKSSIKSFLKNNKLKSNQFEIHKIYQKKTSSFIIKALKMYNLFS